MISSIFSGCPSGWKELNSACYQLSGNKLNWEDAEKSCQGQGGHLASVHSAEQNNFLTGLTTERHWLGGIDVANEGDWVWSDGTAWTFTDWKAGEPTNSGALGNNEDCLEKNYAGIQWNDEGCARQQTFVCQITN